ncbi:MAG: hypothetical protein AAFP84_06950, partial [Actinomycetota bacterium]
MDADDFAADAAGLMHAVELLRGTDAAATDRTSSAPSPDELPDHLPDRGIGSLEALDTLAPSVLHGARDLGAPGFFAHMDPPTPWVTW